MLFPSACDRLVLTIHRKDFQLPIPTSVHRFVSKTKILRNSGFLWCGSRASTIVNRTGPEFRPHDALALFTKMSESEEATWIPEGGADLQVLQSLIQRIQGSIMVRSFNTFRFFKYHSIVEESVLSTLLRRL